jgi:carboxymethylenebutenolidase
VTDGRGLITSDAAVPTPDGPLPVYIARPSGAGPFPIVLVVQEIFGVHEHIRDVVRRLAKLGYFAIAPELFFRHPGLAEARDVPSLVREIFGKIPDAEVLADLDRALTFAGLNGGDVQRAAVTGFCWGGRIAWLYAVHNPGLRAAVAWYGRLDGDRNPLMPAAPIDVVARLSVPVLGLYGGADQGIPQADVDRIRAALKSGTSASEIVVYPGAQHAFFADYRPSYDPEAAEDGWTRLRAWFEMHGLPQDPVPAQTGTP